MEQDFRRIKLFGLLLSFENVLPCLRSVIFQAPHPLFSVPAEEPIEKAHARTPYEDPGSEDRWQEFVSKERREVHENRGLVAARELPVERMRVLRPKYPMVGRLPIAERYSEQPSCRRAG
jgi:hypothetical protein